MKSCAMSYKGYKAAISYNEDDKIYAGKVLGVDDSLNFHGNSNNELETSFHDCIENYLSICNQVGKEPRKK